MREKNLLAAMMTTMPRMTSMENVPVMPRILDLRGSGDEHLKAGSEKSAEERS